MKEVQARFPKGSREYEVLEYRIMCGQLYQQNAIDKTKGIESKPIPPSWYSWNANKINKKDSNNDKKRKWFNRKILAEKKPYFMMYVYPQEKAKYDKYIKATNEKCLMEFGKSISELLASDKLSTKESNFIKYYYIKMPLGISDCTINKICRKFEKLFDNILKYNEETNFDYSILKSDTDYSKEIYANISKIYKEYNKKLKSYCLEVKKQRIRPEDSKVTKFIITDTFKTMCYKICPNEDELCNIVLDLCYTNNNTKQFAWDMCGNVFIKNLLKKNGNTICYPTRHIDGDIEYGGEKYKMEKYIVNVEEIKEENVCN